jgi:integrase
LRKSELHGLSWDDVDFVARTFFVRQVWPCGRFKVPKTETSVRRIEFPASLVTELKAHKLACSKGERDLVFPTETGGPRSPSNLLHRGFRPALRRAGIRKVHFQDLRHSLASPVLARGAKLGPVSKQLGHASIAITLNVYRHVLPARGAA